MTMDAKPGVNVPMVEAPGQLLVPDAPKEDLVDVVVTCDSWHQILNRRVILRRLEEDGVQVPPKTISRSRGQRVKLDRIDLPRLLGARAIELVENIDAREKVDNEVAKLQQRAAELEAKAREERERALEEARTRHQEATQTPIVNSGESGDDLDGKKVPELDKIIADEGVPEVDPKARKAEKIDAIRMHRASQD